MKEYLTYLYSKKPSWDEVPTAEIDCYQWECDKPYRPRACAKMVFVENEGVYALLMCEEENPRTVCKSTGEKVYQDSCLELFLSLGDAGYINIETNSDGVYLSEFGKSRAERALLSDITDKEPTIAPVRNGNMWGNEIFIPNALLSELYPDFSSVTIGEYRGNFYKCGDLTETPHYGSFSPMRTLDLGFHDPEYFAYFIVKRKN